MGFGFAGAAAGASRSLEEIVAHRLLAEKLQAEIANRQQQTAMDQQQIDQRAKEFGVESGQRQQQIDMQLGDRRARNNDTGVRRMISESLMQGGEPDRKALAAMQIEAGDAPTMLNEPPQRLRAVTTPGPGGRPINRMVPETEAVEEYREPKTGPAPPRTPQFVRMPDGSVKDINNVAPPGAMPIDAVAERQKADKTAGNERALEAMRTYGDSLVSVIDSLIDEQGNLRPDVAGVIGGVQGARPEWAYATEGSQGALANIDRLQSMLNISTLQDMKSQSRTGATGFGALSERELNVVESSASKLRRRRQGDADYAAELKRIRDEIKAGRQVKPKTGTGNPLPNGSTVTIDPEAAALALIERARAGRKPGG